MPQTLLTTSVYHAASFISVGGIVAFPTETVYGLGANIFDERAIAKIFEAKQRPADNPLIAHVSETKQISEIVASIPAIAAKLIDAFFPGPLTIVLNKSERVPTIATAGLNTLGVRMPGNPIAAAFIEACGTPLVAPSANLSGRPSPTTWQAVFDDLDGRIDCILQGEPTDIGLESTVVDCTGEEPVVLRTGAFSIENLQKVAPSVRLLEPSETSEARSPGMRHKHYAPSARVVIVESDAEIKDSTAAYIGISTPNPKFQMARICSSLEDYAKSLFAFFRECDHAGIKTIYCERVEETGIGAALMDRLRRAETR